MSAKDDALAIDDEAPSSIREVRAATPARAHKPAPVAPLTIPKLHRGRNLRMLGGLVLVGAAVAAFLVLRPRASEVDPIRTELVARRTIVRAVSVNGHLDVAERVDVPAPTAGALVSIDVVPGDAVTEGQPLARLDERRVGLAVRSANATLTAASSHVAAARVTLDAARGEVERLRQLAARGLSSEADVQLANVQVEQAETALRAARAEEAVAASGLASAELGRDLSVMRSPIAGVVLQAPRTLGTFVGPERGPLFVIGVGVDELRINASVGEADVGQVRVGQNATFEVPAYPGRTFTATVTRVDLDADVEPGAVSYPVQFRAQNPERVLRPGMTTLLRIEVARAENVLTVHEAALRFTPEGAEPAPARSRVWVRRGPSELVAVDVTAGVSDGAYTEIVPAEGSVLAERAKIAIGMQHVENGGRAGITLGSERRRAGGS